MSDDAEKVVHFDFWQEKKSRGKYDDGPGGGGGDGPPIGPPGGDGSSPMPTFGSEDMLSEELSKELGEDWKCAWPSQTWYRWDGKRWDSAQGDFLVRQRAQLVARRIAAPVDDKRLARAICRKAAVNGAIAFCSSNERHAIWDGEFDQEDNYEINTPAGILFLRTGFIAPHVRSRMLTRLTRAAPQPGAQCPRWMQFLDEITGRDRALKDYLQRMAGYFLTGDISEHAIFFLHGKSRTGKTVFLNTLKALLGDYAISAAMDLFIQQEGTRHSTDVMDLKGPRLVIAVETQEGQRWNDALLKQIAGGDSLRARRMRKDPEEFAVHCKLGLAGNHKPRIRLGDDGMRTRFRVVPCRYRQPVLDKNLADKLKEELSGIFCWALEGTLKHDAGADLGLEGAPTVIREATDEYFDAQDIIKRFIEAECELGPDYTVLTEDLYAAFKAWCDRVGERWLPLNKFAEKLGQLDELGIEKGWRHPKTDRRGFRGLRLRQAQQEFR